MPEAQIPIMIMTPNKAVIQLTKPKIKQHPEWEPYCFDNIDFYLTPEQEELSEYCKFRKWLIDKVSEYFFIF